MQISALLAAYGIAKCCQVSIPIQTLPLEIPTAIAVISSPTSSLIIEELLGHWQINPSFIPASRRLGIMIEK